MTDWLLREARARARASRRARVAAKLHGKRPRIRWTRQGARP